MIRCDPLTLSIEILVEALIKALKSKKPNDKKQRREKCG